MYYWLLIDKLVVHVYTKSEDQQNCNIKYLLSMSLHESSINVLFQVPRAVILSPVLFKCGLLDFWAWVTIKILSTNLVPGSYTHIKDFNNLKKYLMYGAAA